MRSQRRGGREAGLELGRVALSAEVRGQGQARRIHRQKLSRHDRHFSAREAARTRNSPRFGGGPAAGACFRIKTAAEPLTLHRLALDENRYPYENEGSFDGGDAELPGVIGSGGPRHSDVRARDLHGLPVLRAAHVRRRHAPGIADHRRDDPRRPAGQAGHRTASISRAATGALSTNAIPPICRSTRRPSR